MYCVQDKLCFSLTSIARADLIGHWPLDEGVGITAADESGFGNDGTLVDESQWVPGYYGGAIQLPGRGQYLFWCVAKAQELLC